jgi:hypothetical protein
MANLLINTPSYFATADMLKYWTQYTAGGMGVTSGWYAFITGAGYPTFSKAFPAQSGFTVGFLFKHSGAGAASSQVVEFLDVTGTTHCDLRFNPSSGVFSMTRNNGGTLLLTGTTILAANTEYYIEFQVVIADSGGVGILHIDGSVDAGVNSSSLDTRNGGSASAATVKFWFVGSSGIHSFKNIYINDNSGGVDDTFWGPITVATSVVTGAGNKAQHAPSAGSNYQNVDDATPNDDTDYNSTSTNGHIDTFVMSDTGYSAGTVKGIEWVADVKKVDASGTARVAPVFRIGGADYVGADISPSTSYLLLNQRSRLQPVGGTPAWDVSTIDAMEVGIKRTAA